MNLDALVYVFQADVPSAPGETLWFSFSAVRPSFSRSCLQRSSVMPISVVAHDKVTAAFLQKALYGNFRPPPLGFTAMNDRVFHQGL